MQQKVNPLEEFPRVEKLLYKLAWDFSAKYRIPFEETRSEAYAGFMKACNNYRKGKGQKFSTWCHMVVWGFLKSWIIKRAKDKLTFIEIQDDTLGGLPDGPTIKELLKQERIDPKEPIHKTLTRLLFESPQEMMELCDGLSSEAQVMLALLTESPKDLACAVSKREEIEAVKEYMARYYKRKTVEASYNELRERIVEVWS